MTDQPAVSHFPGKLSRCLDIALACAGLVALAPLMLVVALAIVIESGRPVLFEGQMRIGFVVGVTNPKTILFFVAFLPQFANARAGHVGVQMAVLGVVFGAMAICSDSIWALVAGRARDWLARKPRRLDRLGVAGGSMMVGLGVTMLARA